MKRVLILHGWGGSDFPHWQSRLACELAKDYGCVSFLKFSNIDFPNKDIWLGELRAEIAAFAPNVVVCHSIANTLWFHLCSGGATMELEKLFLVAPPSFGCNIKELESFFPCHVPKKLYAKEALLITSTNDPYMSQDEAAELQNALKIEMKVLQNAGHINTAGGYGEWQWILEEIKR
ncbi:MAG: alpha/beta hydrolase [Sulfurimonas sp.]|uniref:RBBP9/YdeN family alpha/beta hydrolase n=1 Tax=Sulfurimonas sp. TaxID=2022749 RepID=UPI00261A1DE9|nr:alpha/beta hydrolase [Sulfurimonas sp.]MDD2651858.1 alpha/beta hydrolase [Sulfurimonas sp.]MDD3451825.1 alpha/beta hydrolase [Sulfurimonas sp.]